MCSIARMTRRGVVLEAVSMSLAPELRQKIESIIASDPVVLFMKGNRSFPQCGFSAAVVQILDTMVPNYTTVNVLADASIRDGIKA